MWKKSNGRKTRWNGSYPILIAKARHVVDGDKETFAELLSLFRDHLPDQLRRIESAVRNRDGEALRFHAHQLKGAMRNFAAEEACNRAFALETAGLRKEFDGIEELHRALVEEVKNIENYIKTDAWKQFF